MKHKHCVVKSTCNVSRIRSRKTLFRYWFYGLYRVVGFVPLPTLRGLGVDKSIDKALFWYKKSRKANKNDSCLNIANLYQRNGNRRAALYWWNKGISEGDGEAALALAKTFLEGNGNTQRKKAKELLRLATSFSNITEAGKEEAEDLLLTL